MLKIKLNKNEENTQIKTINNSLDVKSIIRKLDILGLAPKITLNQHLLNPINPKKLATNKIKIETNGAVSNKPE